MVLSRQAVEKVQQKDWCVRRGGELVGSDRPRDVIPQVTALDPTI